MNYSKEFKIEALKLSDEIGCTTAWNTVLHTSRLEKESQSKG